MNEKHVSRDAMVNPRWSIREWSTVLIGALLSFAMHAAAAETFQRGEFRFEVADPPSWVVPHVVPDTWNAQIAGADAAQWRTWLIDTQIDRRHGQRIRYFDSVIEPVSSEMIRTAGKIQLWFNPEFQQLTLHQIAIRRGGLWLDRLVPDSVTLARRESEFERDMSTGTVSVLLVIDDVRAGDLVRTTYSVAGMNPIMAGLANDELQFAGLDPLLDRHARILFDKGTKISEFSDSGAPKSKWKSIPGAIEWTANAHAVAPIIDEGFYPRWYSPFPEIVVGAQRDWSVIARWASSLYPAPKPLPADLLARVAEWRKFPDVDARIAAALRVTQEDVRYFGIELGSNSHQPSEPADTWTRRFGDCKDKARLLATLLGELGIEAYPALVSAEWEMRVTLLPPSASSFDHVIVQVRLPDATLWLDPTQTQQRGSIRSISPGPYGVALPVAADTRALATIAIPKDIVDQIKVRERFVPDASGEQVDYTIRTEYQGGSAQRLRGWLQTAGRETIARNYEDTYRRRYGELESLAGLVTKDVESTGGLIVDEHYVLKKPWLSGSPRLLETVADGIVAEVELPRTAERTSPYAIRYPVVVEHSTVFEIPSGWTWASVPEKRVLEDKGISFGIDARQVGSEVRIDRKYRALQTSLEAEGFASHYSLLREVNELVSSRIVISPTPINAEKQRNERLQNLMRGLLDERSQRNSESAGD